MNRIELALLVLLCSCGFVGCDPMDDPQFRELQNPLQVTAELTALHGGIVEYAKRNAGRYPSTLDVLMTPAPDGYLYIKTRELPVDPWGNDYIYTPPTTEDPVPRVMCYGRDGVPGGEGADSDSTSVD